MKRSWIGFSLLVVLLLAGVLSSGSMTRIHEPIEETLQQAAGYAMEENWEQARAHFSSARERWKKWEHLRTCFADHTPVEEIDGSFELLTIYCAARETVAFAGGCQQLARQVAAVGEAHELVWWNLI